MSNEQKFKKNEEVKKKEQRKVKEIL